MGSLFPFLPLQWHFLWEFRWRDLVDIALMTFLVYQTYIRLRGTQAARIGAGLAVLGVLYLLAQTAGLLLTTWVLGGLWAAAFILVIVLFQAEIRQVLGHLNLMTPSLLHVFRRATPTTGLTDFLNIPEDLNLVGQHTQEVYLGVRGSRELLRFLNQSRLRAEIDLKEAKEGTTRYPLSAHEVNLPLGLQVAGVDPPTVTVHLKKKPLPRSPRTGTAQPKNPRSSPMKTSGQESSRIDEVQKDRRVGRP